MTIPTFSSDKPLMDRVKHIMLFPLRPSDHGEVVGWTETTGCLCRGIVPCPVGALSLNLIQEKTVPEQQTFKMAAPKLH